MRGELGLFPILCKVLVNICSNWQRITRSDSSSMLYRSYLTYCDRLYHNPSDKCNYAKEVRDILSFFGFEAIWHNQKFAHKSSIKRYFRPSILSKYVSAWRNEVLHHEKLRSYKTFKDDFLLEPYLQCLPLPSRSKFCKLRISSHRLGIETGRFTNTPKEDRLCHTCSSNSIKLVDDEFHAVMVCSKYVTVRDSVFSVLHTFTAFDTLKTDSEKFHFIMSYCKDSEIVKAISLLIDAIIIPLKPV